ncbi:hypothetical protein N665_0344s0005 [Sinapis alba]|nr:hypothetical protein N665_0344s0005 [Sinapis alba]
MLRTITSPLQQPTKLQFLELTKTAKEVRDAKSAEDAKAAKEAREAKEARDAEETKEVKKAEDAEEGKASKGSIVIMDKQKPTASDLETEEARRFAKSEAGLANVRARSERQRKLASSQQSPFQGNNTTKIIIPNKKIGRGYDPFALPVDKRRSSALTDMLKKDRWYITIHKMKPPGCPSLLYWTLRSPLEWLTDSGNNTTKIIIPNKKIGRGYDPFALPVDKRRSSALTDMLKKDRWYITIHKMKPPGCPSLLYWTLRSPLEWLTDSHMDAFINVLRKWYTNDPHMFRSEKMCILDHAFAQWWMSKYPDWVSSEPDANGLGRMLPGGGAWDLYGGVVPSFCQTNKIWRIHVDDIYAPVNYKNSHWLAIWISIPKRHIVVWDNIVGCIRKAQLDQVMALFVNMVPYLLVECAATVEERCKYSLEPFTYEVANAPQCESGDCGLFVLKYIECHALGFPFSGSLNPKNSKAIREKMTVDIFEEIPDAHQTEITDVDVNQDIRHTYDIQTTSKRLPDDFHQKTSTRRHTYDIQMTSRRLPPDDYHQTTYRRLPPDDIQTTSGRLPDDFHRLPPDDIHTTSTKRHPDDYIHMTCTRRLPDDF